MFREGPGHRPKGLSQHITTFVETFPLFKPVPSPFWKTAKSVLLFKYRNIVVRALITRTSSTWVYHTMPNMLYTSIKNILGAWIMLHKFCREMFHEHPLKRAGERVMWEPLRVNTAACKETHTELEQLSSETNPSSVRLSVFGLASVSGGSGCFFGCWRPVPLV